MGERGLARLRALALAAALGAPPLAGAARAELPADLVLRGGAVYTLDAARSWAQAVAVRDGRVVYVGSDAGAAAHLGPQTRVVELSGRMLLPSFQDAHVHPVSAGVELGQCDLNDRPTRQAILEKVAACAAERPDAGWVVGGGWSLPAFPGGAPRKQDLDAIVPERPVFLSAADGHSAWVNSQALALAGVTAATPDPPNGRIERDPATGEPTGTLRESAMGLVGRRLPLPSAEQRVEGVARAVARLNAFGITAVQEAAARRELLEAYREAERRGGLSLRVVAALDTDPERGLEQVDELASLRREFTSRRLDPRQAKIFADGVIEARTAAMLEPYLDRAGERGTPNWQPERLNPLVARLVREGFGVHIHAIGDRAVRIGLDALEAAGARRGDAGPRHQLAHVQVIDAADVPRFRELGVAANFQPLWAFADSYITELTIPGLGPERTRRIYPIADLVRAGAALAFGSDWSVSSPNPLEGVQVAVTRQDVAATRGAPFLPEQAIDLATALAAYTIGGAWANGLEAETGSIEVGKAADLVVLDRNLFALPVHEIAQARVLLTLLDGEAVYRDPALGW